MPDFVKKIFHRHPYVDRQFWFLYMLLVGFAIIALFSAGSTLIYKGEGEQPTLGPISRQMGFLALGCALMYGFQFLPSKVMTWIGYFALGFALLYLYVMLIPGNPLVVEINDAARWARLWPSHVTFQPSEVAKFGLIIVAADLLTKCKTDEEKRKNFFITLALTVITILPIMMSNLSTAVLLFGIVLLMWILARVNWKYIASVVGIAIALLLAGYCIVEFGYVRPHRRLSGPFSRAITWVNRVDAVIREKQTDEAEFKITNENYQRSLAKVAIMRGGKTPLGVFPGNSQERDYLPYAYEDYIFAIIVEESGLVGTFILIFIYLAILFRACFASTKFGDDRAMLTVMGLALMLTCQALVSMAVSVGLGPVTGQPLPLVSHGGTSVLVTSMYFAVMMCVSREQEAMRDRQQTAKQESLQDIPQIDLTTPITTAQ